MPAGWCDVLDVQGSPVRGDLTEFRSARSLFADLGAAAAPVVGSFAGLREAGLGGSARAAEAAGEWVQPFAELVDAALGDVPRVCDELAASFGVHLDGLEALWLDADDALVRAGVAHHRVEAARRGLGAAERRLDNETASRIGEQQLWDLKDPGRLCSIVSGGWDWFSDLDNLHLVLDIAGMVPGLGDVADASTPPPTCSRVTGRTPHCRVLPWYPVPAWARPPPAWPTGSTTPPTSLATWTGWTQPRVGRA